MGLMSDANILQCQTEQEKTWVSPYTSIKEFQIYQVVISWTNNKEHEHQSQKEYKNGVRSVSHSSQVLMDTEQVLDSSG